MPYRAESSSFVWQENGGGRVISVDNTYFGLNHFDRDGKAVMVDVTDKAVTRREAVASGEIRVSPAVFRAVCEGTAEKGDVLGTARIAGIMAAKKTSELIPLCHILPLTGVFIDFFKDEKTFTIRARCTARVTGRTGVEMEAMTGASVALLTIYDMCKAIDKAMVIGDIHLEKKSGGKSGDFVYSGN